MRQILFFGLFAITFSSQAQVFTIIATTHEGEKDTVKFGFVQNATLGEDAALGEQNVFMTPVNGYESRVLQRDSIHYSCARDYYETPVYFPDNFDSKFNYRDPLDTSLQNRLFEIWHSALFPDSMEFICDIPFKSFIAQGLVFPADCDHEPPPLVGLWVISDDTSRYVKFKVENIGFRQQVFVTKPGITTALKELENPDKDLDVYIYPNPTSGIFYIQSHSQVQIERIYIYNSIGNLIESFNAWPSRGEFDLGDYASGTYIIQFIPSFGNPVSRIIFKQ